MRTAKPKPAKPDKPVTPDPTPAVSLPPAPLAVPSPAEDSFSRRPSRLNRWIVLCLVMMVLAVVYGFARDILYRRVLRALAQDTLNSFATGTVESMDRVELTPEGNIRIHGGVVTHLLRGKRRTFYRAERIDVALDGWPLREKVYVSRVDLFHPEIWVVRERGGDWNIVWGLQAVPGQPEPPPPPPAPDDPPPPPPGTAPFHPPRGGWPRNGVHIHDGTIHFVFMRDDGSELALSIANVNAPIVRAATGIRFGPMRATFYGGDMRADATVPSYDPFRMNLQLSVRGADVTRLAEGRPFVKRMPRGRLDAVLALTADRESIGERPICAGRVEIRDGDLWDLPAFIGVLAQLQLTNVGERKLKAAQLEFTVERHIVRIDHMNFLGEPLNLFGNGTMDLTGENLDVSLVPRIGKSFDEILPILGTPIQWLLNIIKGAFITVKISGAFWAPEFVVNGEPISAPLQEKIIETERREK